MCTAIGERIRVQREAYGMSQAELSRRIGMSKQGMNSIEQGHTPNPGVLHVMAIAAVLGISLDTLVGMHASCAKD